MWINGKYRIRFKHEHADIFSPELDEVLSTEEVEFFSKRAIFGLSRISTAIIERRIEEDGLSAWVEISRGYAFCQKTDTFSRRKGRLVSLTRALRRMKTIPGPVVKIIGDHYLPPKVKA